MARSQSSDASSGDWGTRNNFGRLRIPFDAGVAESRPVVAGHEPLKRRRHHPFGAHESQVRPRLAKQDSPLRCAPQRDGNPSELSVEPCPSRCCPPDASTGTAGGISRWGAGRWVSPSKVIDGRDIQLAGARSTVACRRQPRSPLFPILGVDDRAVELPRWGVGGSRWR